MTIPVDCPGCQAHYEAPEKFAGQRMKCKACGTVLTVTAPELDPIEEEEEGGTYAPASLDDLLDSSQGKGVSRSGGGAKFGAICPECKAAMNPEDVLCIECGYNVVKKKSMKEVKRKKKKKGSGGGPTSPMPEGMSKIFSTDIVFCVLQGGLAVLALVALENAPGASAGAMEQLSVWAAMAMAIVGITADSMMLKGNPKGWMAGYAAIGLTGISIAVTTIARITIAQTPPPPGMELRPGYAAGAMIGAFVGVIIRGLILKWYVGGVMEFENWANGGKARVQESDF